MVLPDQRRERRRRFAQPDLARLSRVLPREADAHLLAAAAGTSVGSWQTELRRRGEIEQHPDYADNPYRPR